VNEYVLVNPLLVVLYTQYPEQSLGFVSHSDEENSPHVPSTSTTATTRATPANIGRPII
jgi:hypothetical protein